MIDKIDRYLGEERKWSKEGIAAATKLQKQRRDVRLVSGDTEEVVKNLTSIAASAISDLTMYLENFGNKVDANQIDKLGVKIVSIGHKAARKTKR